GTEGQAARSFVGTKRPSRHGAANDGHALLGTRHAKHDVTHGIFHERGWWNWCRSHESCRNQTASDGQRTAPVVPVFRFRRAARPGLSLSSQIEDSKPELRTSG